MPADLLTAISDGTITNSDCSKWAFLDTETTGLAGGSGTYAFLIGVGRITPAGFELRQFFMRDLAEEASLLMDCLSTSRQFDTLVTYNGKTYDQPLARNALPNGSDEAAVQPYGASRSAVRRTKAMEAAVR